MRPFAHLDVAGTPNNVKYMHGCPSSNSGTQIMQHPQKLPSVLSRPWQVSTETCGHVVFSQMCGGHTKAVAPCAIRSTSHCVTVIAPVLQC